MGCTSSKVDDLPAVVLCRERCQFLEEAINQRYALAESHVAYFQSLKAIGLSLQNFFNQDLDSSTSPYSPVLPLPTQRKGDPVFIASPKASKSPAPPGKGFHSHSNSGSHIHFHSDSEDEDDDFGSLHHSGNSSPLHSHDHQDYHFPNDYETQGSVTGGFMNMNMNFMKNRATKSVIHEQRPINSESVHHVGESSSYYSSSYPYPTQNPSVPPYNGYQNYGGGGGGGEVNSYFGSYAPQFYGSSSPPPGIVAPASPLPSSSKPPPPPPSPPSNSTWDFLNPFETFERYYPPYTPSRDSKEVREEEGIPDLEDEDYRNEVVKEVHGNQKFVDGGGNYSKAVENENRDNDGKALHQTRPSVSMENGGMEYEVHVVEKNVVSNEEQRSEDRGNVAAFKVRPASRDVSEVVREIKDQFVRASESGNEVAKTLEAGIMQYHQKKSVYQVSSKMLHVTAPSSVVSSQPSTSKSAEPTKNADSVYLDIDEDVRMRSRNLSSILQQLYMWEKKLYDEVKAEEKLRIVHERKRHRLKRLDERGAEAHKVDTTRTLIRSLSTKITMSIQVVDKIAVQINKLRDEELWPQINELIQRLRGMWKVMLECHRYQCQAMAEAKNFDAMTSNKKLSDAHLEATMHLELELLNWILSFSSWTGAHKGYIRALNSWLLKCLLYEPEETPDGIVPFSPGRIGAPPVFVICNQWSQSMDRISETEVIGAMRGFATSVLQLWHRHNLDIRQRMMADPNKEKKIKALERDEQKMHKAIQAIDKKMVLVLGQGSGIPIPGEIVHQSDMTITSSLQQGLKQIVEAMERFMADSVQAYEELWARSEEERLSRENARVS